MTRRLLAAAVAAVVVGAWACGGGDTVTGTSGEGDQSGTDVRPQGGADAGSNPPADAGTTPDAGSDAGTDTGGNDAGTDAGTEDGGTDAGVTPTAGPWPTDAVVNYSSRFGVGTVQSVGVDDAYNIWLLKGAEIGVLRPGTTSPVWVSGIGQAAPGFGDDKLARGSTVICGGAAGQAYVGYWTYDLPMPHRESSEDPELLKGDMDVVQLDQSGSISLVEHLWRSAGTSTGWPRKDLGIQNTNDWHYDEDRSVLTCQRVMKGRHKGDLYIGTNHGVTRIQGLVYNSHRHPIWMDGNSHRIGYSYGLGIGQDGNVLIANEWNVGMIKPSDDLTGFDKDQGSDPWLVNTHAAELNSLQEFDYWRAIQQTTDGTYYLGSKDYGLWRMVPTGFGGTANFFEVTGLPTEKINAMQATDDGSLFLGTDDDGLWVMDAQKNFTRFSDVPGSRIRQLVYDPTVSPSMLYVLTSSSLYVVRGR